MVKHTTHCSSCGGKIEIVRDLEDDKGTSEIEEHHVPDCPTLRPARDDARGLASQPALWTARRERGR